MERYAQSPATGAVDFGSLRRLTPISWRWGFDRGLPVDRYYIEQFMARHAADIKGRVCEIDNDAYTREFGGDRVEWCDILSLDGTGIGVTLVGDLSRAEHIASDLFDCVILTQMLHLISDLEAALQHVHRVLKSGGVVLATVPGLTRIDGSDAERFGYVSIFSSHSVRREFERVFPATAVSVEAYGNVLSATAFLYGLAAEELSAKELRYRDPEYEVTVAVRAQKPSSD
jgi:SAM-dependent methyltransferase